MHTKRRAGTRTAGCYLNCVSWTRSSGACARQTQKCWHFRVAFISCCSTQVLHQLQHTPFFCSSLVQIYSWRWSNTSHFVFVFIASESEECKQAVMLNIACSEKLYRTGVLRACWVTLTCGWVGWEMSFSTPDTVRAAFPQGVSSSPKGRYRSSQGGGARSLQTGIMKYQLPERLVLPSGWLANAQFTLTSRNES